MKNISKLLLPSILGVSAYLIVKKYFPEKIKNFDEDPLLSLRGGVDETKILSKIFKQIMTDRAVKIGLLTIFGTAVVQYFQAEIEAILIDDVFNHICVRDTEGNLKIVCNIVKEHELHLHTKSMRELIVSNNLSDEQKISLLKIKLDFMVNDECGGKARFLVMVIIAATLTFTISGIGGLTLMLEALYRLFQEGKISKAIYNQIIKALAKRWGGDVVPVEHLLE
uniref:hypothetical protein n=1 Tax=Haslea pseudostrearia TaxID=197756 RepID=UPI0022045992|nr:hypothetical protein ON958_pgp038 [Haslea pseudostrearia]UXN44662.1 hypothetical protein [Haslea pseudostrearia]